MATDFTTQITGYYQTIQYRTPPAAELATYNAALQSGTLTTAQVISGIENSSYTQSYVNAVIREYQAAFGRVPDTAGITYWVGVVSANPTALANLNTIFASSTEFTNRYGATATTASNPALVTALYTNVLGRAPDAAGLAYWSSQNLNASQLLQSFAQSPEFITNTTSFVTAYQNAEAAGTAPTTGSLFSVTGGTTPVTSFSFTTGVDNLTGTSGADVFVADQTAGAGKYTFTAVDTVTGGDGIDTIKIFSDGTAAAIAAIKTATITGVENIFINNLGANNIDVSGLKGVTGLQLDAPGASSTETLAGQTFTLSNETTGGYTFTLASTSDTTEAITLSNVKADTIDLSGTKVTSASIASTGSANSITLTDTGAALTSLKITGDQALSLTESLASVKTVDASAASGAVKLDVSGVALNAAFAFTGGTGNDTLTLKAGAIGLLTAGTQLDGGAGKDTLTVNDTSYSASDYAKLAAVKNFEVFSLATTGATIDASQITNFKEFAVSTGTETINNIGSGTTLDINGATTAINLGGAVGTTAATINLGTSSAAGFTTTALTVTGLTADTLNVAGTSAQTITALHNSDNTTLTITGSTDLTIGSIDATTTGSKIDASGFTGKLSVIGSTKADIIIGGSGNDTLATGGGSDTLTGGAGTDKFDVSASIGGSTTVATINDIATKESLILNAGNGTNVFTTAKVDVSAAADLTAALNLAAAGDGSANSKVSWFQFGGNTYVVEDNTAGATLAATDQVVKLVGTVDLSTATFTAGTHTLVLA